MRDYQIVVLGSGGVGKSALTVQFIQNAFVEQYDPTIEDSYRKQFEIDNQYCNLEILDTAGTEQFTAIRDLYMKNGEGFIFVFSVTSQPTFDDLRDLYEQIRRVKNSTKVPIVIAGNKCDLGAERVVSAASCTRLANEWNIPFFETSARYRVNVDELFFGLVKQINMIRPKPNRTRKQKCSIL